MATRYYTEEAYQQIKQTIQEIDEGDVSGLTDFFSDLWGKIAQFIGILKMDDYQSSMQEWYNHVLDSHNTTIAKVTEIFNNVAQVDTEYANSFAEQKTIISEFRSAVTNLMGVISGTMGLADAQSAASKSIAKGTAALNNTLKEIVTKKEQRVLWDASMDLIGDALKIGSNFMGFFGAVLKHDGTKATVYIKKLTDTFCATFHDLNSMAKIMVVPIAAIVVSKCTNTSYGDFLNWEFNNVIDAEKSVEINSTTDFLQSISDDLEEDLSECKEGAYGYGLLRKASEAAKMTAIISKQVDTVVDVYDVADTFDGWMDTAGEWSTGKVDIDPITGKENIQKITGAEKIGEIIKESTGIPVNWLKETPDGKIESAIKTLSNGYKTAGTIWSYGEKYLENYMGGKNEDWITDSFFSKNKIIKTAKDWHDVLEDVIEEMNSSISNSKIKALAGLA